MQIETYNSLDDKANYFDCINIESKNEFDDLANYWTNGKENPSEDSWKRVIFRGLSEAKFKLYNSAQRFWIGQDLHKLDRSYQEFIESQIKKAREFQANLLIKFYKSFGHHAYDLSILSFLQHYGAPTTLLDFTYRFNSAAFFATDGLKHYPSNDIDNYFSIYAIETWKVPNEFPSILDHLKYNLSQIDDILERNKDKEINTDDVLQGIEQLQYKAFHDLTLFHIPGFYPEGYSFNLKNKPNFKLVFNQHNLNIINQEGLFVFNSDPEKPLEYHFSGKVEIGKTFNLPKIKCWNIHKSLNEYVIRYLTEGRTIPIDRTLMFPQEELIAQNAFQEFKNFK